MLSGGNATCQIEPNALQETGMSQVFVAIDGAKLGVDEGTAEAVIASLHGADGVRYPGEQTLSVRQENLAQGVPVDEDLWEQLLRRQF
jgi:3-dehydro-L-gulonate 2-dehydrogenase